MGFESKCDFAPPTVLLGLLLCPWTWGISSKSFQHHTATAPALRSHSITCHLFQQEILQEMGVPDHLTCLLRNLYAGQEATELEMEQQTDSKLGKECIKAVYCHPAYLTNMQSISCIMPG